MTNKERLEDLLIEFDELDMQPMLIVPDPTDRAIRWKHELTYAINHLEAEVAREIFEEMRREIKAALESNYSAKQERVEKQIPDDFVSYMCEGKIAALRGIDDFIDELEQKYTEGDHE